MRHTYYCASFDLTALEATDPAVPICDISAGLLLPGESFYQLCDSVGVSAPLTNEATVTATGPTGKTVEGIDTATLTPPPELRITKSVSTPTPTAGATVIYTLLVENIGQGDATGVVVEDNLPTGMSFAADLTPGRTSVEGSRRRRNNS